MDSVVDGPSFASLGRSWGGSVDNLGRDRRETYTENFNGPRHRSLQDLAHVPHPDEAVSDGEDEPITPEDNEEGDETGEPEKLNEHAERRNAEPPSHEAGPALGRVVGVDDGGAVLPAETIERNEQLHGTSIDQQKDIASSSLGVPRSVGKTESHLDVIDGVEETGDATIGDIGDHAVPTGDLANMPKGEPAVAGGSLVPVAQSEQREFEGAGNGVFATLAKAVDSGVSPIQVEPPAEVVSTSQLGQYSAERGGTNSRAERSHEIDSAGMAQEYSGSAVSPAGEADMIEVLEPKIETGGGEEKAPDLLPKDVAIDTTGTMKELSTQRDIVTGTARAGVGDMCIASGVFEEQKSAEAVQEDDQVSFHEFVLILMRSCYSRTRHPVTSV